MLGISKQTIHHLHFQQSFLYLTSVTLPVLFSFGNKRYIIATMASNSSVLSQTLQSITSTKIKELDKQKRTYEKRKAKVLEEAGAPGNEQRRIVNTLLAGVKKLNPGQKNGSLENMQRWIEQSSYDPSVPAGMLQGFEEELRHKLDVQTRKFDLAELYSKLLTEWLNPPEATLGDVPALQEKSELDEDFEVVEQDRLKQLRDKFAEVVFTPVETDTQAIRQYMDGLFAGENGEKAYKRLHDGIFNVGENMRKHTKPFDSTSLDWCIRGLLNNELLNDEKKATLQEFLPNDIALAEIADVLNMRYADLSNWSWDAGEQGMPVMPRKQLNGKYRIMMDEDVLQAIFLHYIGTMWCVETKRILSDVIQYTSIWKQGAKMPQDVKDRRQYYLGTSRSNTEQNFSLDLQRQHTYRDDYFLTQLPASVYEGAGGYDDDDENLDDSVKSPKEIRQQLLRQLATEMLIHRKVHGEVAVVQSDFQWFATSIPHNTIMTVLRFMGVPEAWLVFFEKFLRAPLNMNPEPSPDDKAQTRVRGVAMAHVLEKLIGEVVLFIMDLAVNQEAEILLYRLHDDLWLCAEPKKVAKAWKTMQHVADLMGLEINRKKTGSVYLTDADKTRDEEIEAALPAGSVFIGFLKIDPESGKWVIMQDQVDAHIRQLQRQLAGCTSILSWIQTWNSCIGRFFSHTFGEPANCLGKPHVDAILDTHKRMQEILFDGKDARGTSVIEYVLNIIAESFGVKDIPRGFLFMPEGFGGLGLRNPFISLLAVRDQVYKNPEARLRQAFKEEKNSYEIAKREFYELTDQARRRRFRSIYSDYEDGKGLLNPDANEFMNMEEFTEWRETAGEALYHAYTELMEIPRKKDIQISKEVSDALSKIQTEQPDLGLSKLDSEKKWIVQMYGKELFDYCDGLSIVDKSLLPLGVLTMLRNKKVTWQMVL